MGRENGKGKKILFKAHDFKKVDNRWTRLPLSDEEFEYAISKGIMFHHRKTLSHSECIKRTKEILNRISDEDVANAFLYSLSSRRLEYRSALGSYWYVKTMPVHDCSRDNCSICRWEKYNDFSYKYEYLDHYNSLSYERYKYGGVRHGDLVYALFDLEEFVKLPKIAHTKEDEELLLRILDCVSELEPNNKVGALQRLVTSKKIMKSNKNEMSTLLDILGICGILESKEHHCYAEGFMDCLDRDPPETTNDYKYPVNWWRAKDGVNQERVKTVFR